MTNVTPSSSASSPTPVDRRAASRRKYRWGYIYGTRIRTSTAVVALVFVVCVILYGYTSQRYGVVAPPPPVAPRTTVTTPTYSEPPSSIPSSTAESSATTGTTQSPSAPSGESSTSAPSGFGDLLPGGAPQTTQPRTPEPPFATTQTTRSVP